MPKSDIPMGSEFGPNQVDLVKALGLAQMHTGNGEEFIKAIASEYGTRPVFSRCQIQCKNTLEDESFTTIIFHSKHTMKIAMIQEHLHQYTTVLFKD